MPLSVRPHLVGWVVRVRHRIHQSSCSTRAAFLPLYKRVHYHHARGGFVISYLFSQFNKLLKYSEEYCPYYSVRDSTFGGPTEIDFTRSLGLLLFVYLTLFVVLSRFDLPSSIAAASLFRSCLSFGVSRRFRNIIDLTSTS